MCSDAKERKEHGYRYGVGSPSVYVLLVNGFLLVVLQGFFQNQSRSDLIGGDLLKILAKDIKEKKTEKTTGQVMYNPLLWEQLSD